MSSLPALSVVITAFNRAAELRVCLEAVRASSFHDFELIVVDDGSIDGTAEVAESIADKVLVNDSNRGRSYSRLRGFTAATAPIIVSIDSDILIAPETLGEVHLQFTRDPHAKLVTGMLAADQPRASLASQFSNLRLHYLYRTLPKEIDFFYGGLFAFCSDLREYFVCLEECGEDTAVGHRLSTAGVRTIRLPSLQAVHLKRHSLASLLKSDFMMGGAWIRIFIEQGLWRVGRLHYVSVKHLFRYLCPIGLILFLLRRDSKRLGLGGAMLAPTTSVVILLGLLTGLFRAHQGIRPSLE